MLEADLLIKERVSERYSALRLQAELTLFSFIRMTVSLKFPHIMLSFLTGSSIKENEIMSCQIKESM